MTQTLDQKLADLKAQAQQQTATHITSRNQLHQAIVDAYLWWREAAKQEGYLETTYKAAHIDFRKRSSNSPNFYPLVRLVWNMDVSRQAGTISNWARSLLALHEEYTSKPQNYAHKPAADLVNYIKDAGGLGKLRGETQMTAQQLADEENNGVGEVQRGRPKLAAPPPANVLQRKLEAIKSIQAKATIASLPTAVANKDDLVVLIGRRNSKGQIEVIGSDYDDALVYNALFACTKFDRSTVAPGLRLLAEAIEPLALPAKLEKYRKKFYEEGEAERTRKLAEPADENSDAVLRKEHVKVAIRMRVRPRFDDILLSRCQTKVSVVTYVKPHNKFDCAEEVVLRGADRSWLERELLNEQKLTLYSAEPAFGLVEVAADKKTKRSFRLQLQDPQATHNRSLRFYPSDEIPSETNAQVAVADPAGLVWDWHLDASVDWLVRFDASCASAYIDSIRGSFDTKTYRSIQLNAGTKALEWQYWWDAKAKIYKQKYSLEYGSTAKRADKGEAGTFTANAKDMAQIFATLPTLPITSQTVKLSGNTHVLRVAYSTELADYETYIPACDADGNRDSSAFAVYGA